MATINNVINANSITPLPVTDGGTGANSLTIHGLLKGDAAGAVSALPAATDGQLPIGSTGSDPVLATLTAGTNVTITNGAGSITISATGGGGGIVTLDGDSGSATGGTVTLAGGSNITTSATGSTVTFDVSGTTVHAVQVGSAAHSLNSLALGTTGQVLIGLTSGDPSFGALGVNSGLTSHGILLGQNNSAITALGNATNGQLPIGSTGADPVLTTLTSTGNTVAITNGAGSINLETGTTVAASFPTNSGTAVPSLGALTLTGTGNISTSGSGSTATFTLSGTTNHAVQVGNSAGSLTSVALGTTGQVLIGSTAADPSFAALGVNSGLTAHGLLLGQNNSAITALGDATNGQIPIGSTGSDPVLATLTSSGSTITITNGAGSINLESGSAVASSFPTNSGTAVPLLGVLTLTGAGNISTSGTGSTATFTLSGTTNHAVQIGNTGGSLTSLGVGSTGQVLIGATGADPSFGSLGVNSGLTAHGLLLGQNNSAITALGDATNGQLPIGSTGADPVLAALTPGAGITITNGAGSITIASSISSGIITLDGDTGSATGTTVTLAGGNNVTTSASGAVVTLNVSGTTNHAVQIGNASNSLTSLGVGTTGQVLIGSTAADPAFGSLGVNSGLTAHGILLGQNNSAITALGDATNGQIPIGSTGADPVLGTITAGSGITVTNGAGAITIASSISQGIVTLDGDSGAATGTTVTLAGGHNITTSATGSTVTLNVSGTTAHAVQIGNATNSLTSLGVGTTGQVLIGSTGADPAFGALGVNSGLTNHGILLGQNNSAIVALGSATNGQIPIGSTGANPVLATLTSSGGTVAITNGAGTINLEVGGVVTSSFPTDSGTATPSSGALTVHGGSNMNTSGSGSTVTLNLNTSPSVSGSLTAGTSVNAGTVVLSAAGSVGAPSYSFTGNTATGLYAPASGQFALSAAGVNKVKYDGSSVLIASTYRMSAQLTSNANISSGATTQLIFDSVLISSAGYNAGTSTYTVPVSGAYLISILLAAVTTVTGIAQVEVLKNGSTVLFNFPTQWTATGTFSDLTGTALIPLTAGDTVTVFAINSTSGTVTITGGTPSLFSIHLLSTP